MENTLFNSLVYHIIGDPQKWQNSSIDMLHNITDETISLKIEEDTVDFKVGHEIIDRIKSHDEVLTAFSTFLEDSRFGLIILDNQFQHIYHNGKADESLAKLRCINNNAMINSALIKQIKESEKITQNHSLTPLTLNQADIRTIYLKRTLNQDQNSNEEKVFYVLLLPVNNDEKVALHDELKARYQLTNKEESVLIGIIEGKNIKHISEQSFVTQNTVKSHLKSIFHKTETNSQTALISLFLNHEMQLLESYFDFKMPMATSKVAKEKDHFIMLSNNSRLCYRDYGPKEGRPLVVMHNGYGCRLNIPHNYAEICEKLNRRIIIPDRPGIGKSELVKDYPEQWNNYLSEFVDQLALEEFDLLGNTFGCSFALKYAYAMGDKRLKKLILTTPVFINTKDHAQYLGEYLYPGARLVGVSKKIAAEVYNVWIKSMLLNVDKHFNEMLENNLGEKERKHINDVGFTQTIVQNFNEAHNITSKGSVKDLVFTLTPLNLDLPKLTIPVEIWIGDDADNLISPEGAKEICAPIPNQTLHLEKGHGNEIYYLLFEDIIA